MWKSKCYGAFVRHRRVDLHAIDATPARWRGVVVSHRLIQPTRRAPDSRFDLCTGAARRAQAITAERARARRLAACDRAEAAAKSAEAAAARRKKAQSARAVAAAQSAQLRSEREAEEAELEEAVARREREALQRVEAAKAALVENSLVLAESRADDDFSAASSPQLLMPAAEPLDEAIARARSAVEELRD